MSSQFHWKAILLLAALFALGRGARLQAAPPIDVTKESSEVQNVPGSRPTENDLVYVDTAATSKKLEEDFRILSTPVNARSLPGRNGRALFRLKKGERVQFLKNSRDGRWVAVLSLSQRRKGWIPKVALEEKTSESSSRKSDSKLP